MLRLINFSPILKYHFVLILQPLTVKLQVRFMGKSGNCKYVLLPLSMYHMRIQFTKLMFMISSNLICYDSDRLINWP